jgi:hypothetical protein
MFSSVVINGSSGTLTVAREKWEDISETSSTWTLIPEGSETWTTIAA